MQTKRILTSITAATLVMSTMLPTLAAHAATNPLQTLEQAGKKALTNAEKQAKGLLSSMATAGDPTAVQVQRGLLGVYVTQKVWPKFLQGENWNTDSQPFFIAPTPAQAGIKNDPAWNMNPAHWVGLTDVFPGQPANAWTKDLGMLNAPANKPIKAATLAQWIMNWEVDARHINPKWLPTTNSYQLMQGFSFFYGTNITSPNTVITTHDLAMVEKNIVDVGNGYRMLASNKVEVLEPMVNLMGQFNPNWSKNWQLQGLKLFDSATFTFLLNGEVVYNRAKMPGWRLFEGGGFIRNGQVLNTNYPVFHGNPALIKPLSLQPLHVMHYSPYLNGGVINSPYAGKQPFDGTYFSLSLGGPANATSIANAVHKGVHMFASPGYFIQNAHGKILNVYVAGQFQSYPDFCASGAI